MSVEHYWLQPRSCNRSCSNTLALRLDQPEGGMRGEQAGRPLKPHCSSCFCLIRFDCHFYVSSLLTPQTCAQIMQFRDPGDTPASLYPPLKRHLPAVAHACESFRPYTTVATRIVMPGKLLPIHSSEGRVSPFSHTAVTLCHLNSCL